MDENLPTSLPVVTISVLNRLDERIYREQCAERLVEIVVNIENYLGSGRIYIPRIESQALAPHASVVSSIVNSQS